MIPTRIAITNGKGGVGKTTCAVNIGYSLAYLGYKTLLVDTDSQGHIAFCLGLESEKPTITEVLMGMADAEDAIRSSGRDNLDLLPSSPQINDLKYMLANDPGGRKKLTRVLEPIDKYEYCMIDCSPSLDIITQNVLVCANKLLIPVETKDLSIEGIARIGNVIDELETSIELIGVIPNKFDQRRNLDKDILKELNDIFEERVAPVVRETSKIGESPGEGKTIFEYDQKSKGGKDFMRLVEWVVKKIV